MRKTKTVAKVPFLAPDVETKIIPAPTDGWDAISPLAEMDPKRAPILQNWVPRPGYVEIRQGFTQSNKPSTSAVETLMVYRNPSTQLLFAAAGSVIYDVSTAGTNTSVVTGLGSARWQYTNFTPSGANTILACVNGTDQLREFNGTSWSIPAITGFPSGIISTAQAINIYAAKQRIWLVWKNTTIASALGTAAITGAIAVNQDLGPLFTKGGYLVAISDWTIDGGNGPQDYVVFISSRGQIALYSGTDPTNASTWALVGVFNLSPPMGYRCAYSLGSDVSLITEQGVLPISQALPFDPSADRSVAITARIQNAMAEAAQVGSTLFGWQVMAYPLQQLLFLNVPLSENEAQEQFVMNTLTGAWCQFVGWNANCFEVFNETLVWGGNDGSVNVGYDGVSDGGVPVVIDMQCAFNWFDEPGKVKRMTMIQPLLTTNGSVGPTLSIDTDFGTSTATQPISIGVTGALWDTAIWDTDIWPGATTQFTQWLTVEAIGHCFAARIHTSLPATGSDITLQVNAFNAILETGGAI